MRYLSANDHYRQRFGKKMYRVAISLDVTCPNRDGSKGNGGCIFCSAGGSGEFASDKSLPVREQIDMAVAKVRSKAGSDAGYIAYLQSFTNTYCSVQYLDGVLNSISSHPMIGAVIIGTRPDCLPDEMVSLISDYNRKLPVYVEMGLQTSNDNTARLINRCYDTSVFGEAAGRLRCEGINVTGHVILGLPGESVDDMMDSVRYVVDSGCDGIKFTCLFVLKETKLYDMFINKEFEVLGMEEYFDIVDRALDIIPEGMVVYRLTGDGPKSILAAPEWTANKRAVINYINRRFG